MSKNFSTPRRYLTHQITWWKLVAINAAGEAIFNPPVVIAGRWEDKQELFRNRTGDEAVSNAEVLVDRDLEIGDYILLGASAIRDPSLTQAQAIRQFTKTPDLRNLTNTRKAIL